jgi:hypothetical protein
MTDKMTLLFVKHTGHVLAAVTRSADPTGKILTGDLALGGLLVRGFSGQEQFEVPPEQLDVLTVDLEPVLLLQPRAYTVDQGQAVPLPNITAPTVALTATDVTVTLSGPVPADTKVWSQVDGGNLTSPRVADGVIPASVGASAVTLRIEAVDPGTYNVLVLVGGRLPFADSLHT